MPLEILPSSLYGLPNIEIILKNESTLVVFKTLSESIKNKKMYLSMAAVLMVVEGEQHIVKNDGRMFIVKKDEAVILPKDLYVVSDFAIDKVFKAYIIFIDEFLIKKFLQLSQRRLINNHVNKMVKIGVRKQVFNFVSSLVDVYKDNKINNQIVEIKIKEFLLLLELQEGSDDFISAVINPVEKRSIKNFMEDNYLNNLSISDYALLTGRSTSTFTREFKRIFGAAPKKWLIDRRIAKSHELLQSTDMNVSEVAIEVGYENTSHFISAYKKVYGSTPKLTIKKKLTKK